MTLEQHTSGEICPRCGSMTEQGARFCAACGLPLVAPVGQSFVPPPPPVPYAPQGVMPAWVGGVSIAPPVPPPLPGRDLSGRSVIIALTPTRPATWAFWVGLVMAVGALAFAICPLLLAGAFALDPEAGDTANVFRSGVLIAGFVVVGIFVPGLVLLYVGRPRK